MDKYPFLDAEELGFVDEYCCCLDAPSSAVMVDCLA